jgi:hypothetical protein
MRIPSQAALENSQQFEIQLTRHAIGSKRGLALPETEKALRS